MALVDVITIWVWASVRDHEVWADANMAPLQGADGVGVGITPRVSQAPPWAMEFCAFSANFFAHSITNYELRIMNYEL